ncbi:DNA-binding protein [Candidatus Wolfebacteria bacterium]|nr:DNA-binding protein [Candidatus Wolfebacteria bacterium]
MKLILHDNRRYVLRFDKGDEAIEGLAQFAEQEKINAAAFWGIGAAQGTTLSYYDLNQKKYQDKELNERLEIASLIGNVATMRDTPSVIPAKAGIQMQQSLDPWIPPPPGYGRAGQSEDDNMGKVVIHAHGSFSDKEMKVVAGHVKRLVVSATCEIFLTAMDGKLEREYSEEIGLNLLK